MSFSVPLVGIALQRLAATRPVPLTVRGDCMRPLLHDRQKVVVAAARRYWPGDVVAFIGDDAFVVHRVIGYRWREGRLALQTRADAAGTLDPPVALRQIIGRVVEPALPPRRLRSGWRFLRLWAQRLLPR